MKNYIVTHNYIKKEFEKKEQAMAYIEERITQNTMKAKLVYQGKIGNAEILIYQYWTLYNEIFFINDSYNLAEDLNKLLE